MDSSKSAPPENNFQTHTNEVSQVSTSDTSSVYRDPPKLKRIKKQKIIFGNDVQRIRLKFS